jgi:hypothetical protein
MNDDDKTISRGGVIQRLILAPIAIGAYAALRAEAEAAATIDKKASGYVTHPVGGKQCSTCALYIPAKTNATKSPGTCKLVKGSIAPNAWCKFFSPKAH